jgi:hypothetical protein
LERMRTWSNGRWMNYWRSNERHNPARINGIDWVPSNSERKMPYNKWPESNQLVGFNPGRRAINIHYKVRTLLGQYPLCVSSFCVRTVCSVWTCSVFTCFVCTKLIPYVRLVSSVSSLHLLSFLDKVCLLED